MSAGFGQVDLGSRMEIQRRITARFGGVTTRLRLRTDRGSETGLMTRFHLVRIWRDGSVVFVIFFALLAILPAALGGGAAGGVPAVTVTQTPTFFLGILAMNWGFYQREDLWRHLSAPQALVVAARALSRFAAEAQATVLIGFLIGLTALGLRVVSRLAATFRL